MRRVGSFTHIRVVHRLAFQGTGNGGIHHQFCQPERALIQSVNSFANLRIVISLLSFTQNAIKFVYALPFGGGWLEALNSDAVAYGGSGLGNLGRVEAVDVPANGRRESLDVVLPPLACVFLVPAERA